MALSNQLNPSISFIDRLRLFSLVLLLAFSFGGFTFYAGVVIPIGSDVLDSTTQGFVTQKVTWTINVASVISLAAMLWEGLAAGHFKTLRFKILIAIYVVSLLSLFVLHPRLGEYLSYEDFSVNDFDQFYSIHRIYLWISTIQWLSTPGLIWELLPNPQGAPTTSTNP
ncbi:MAG: hypothetical protein AAGA30_12820 [Planctomycetota bacterium]